MIPAEIHKWLSWKDINSTRQNECYSQQHLSKHGKFNMTFVDDIPFVAQMIRKSSASNLQLKVKVISSKVAMVDSY